MTTILGSPRLVLMRLRRQMSTRSIEVTHLPVFPSYWPPHGVDTFEPKPLIPRPYTLPCAEKGTFFTITDELYTGKGQWSQVYRGTLICPSSPPIDDAVLKVYCEPLFPPCGQEDYQTPPEAISILSDPDKESHRYTGELMAWQESWAYNKLAPLQGKCVPKFFGAFQSSVFGDNRIHMATLMSYVDGKHIVERCSELVESKSDLYEEQWYPKMRDVYELTHRIHELGVANLDIRKSNIKIDPESGRVVFFDFASARPSRFPTEEDAKIHRVEAGLQYDSNNLDSLLYAICGNEHDSHQFYRRRAKFMEWAIEYCSHEPWFKALGNEFEFLVQAELPL
ncbi:hypothetical protein DFP72DRAFT_531984 [Ephemerocybe angulata]|uniref:Protein kinase domain-containing protein n=1 Tax=Ephemerocybe angulata TaxID=980116 RepID=A0A8H6HMM6_9AGAR|nr:hypothetical protein DFP72DRAFT_531984 [Tulosesus angulatus]